MSALSAGRIPPLCLGELPWRDTVPAVGTFPAMLDSPSRVMLRPGIPILPLTEMYRQIAGRTIGPAAVD
jgi:hypothetical protein